MEIRPTDALLVVDVQNDFCDGGALAVPGADDSYVAALNPLLQRFSTVVLTQDWHPAGHGSFASSHAGRRPFDQVQLFYGPQTLWPDHCVQETPGAEFHPGLDWRRATLVVRKGMNPAIDSYSGFRENDKQTVTGLRGYLQERGVTRLVLVGLAFDYCVRFTAVDGAEHFDVVVAPDACRAIGDTAATEADFARLGIKSISAASLLG